MADLSSKGNVKLNDFVAIVWRHKWKFGLIFGPILLMTLIFAIALPAVYRSHVTVLVEAPEIPETEVKSSADGYVEARLASIENRILSTSVLREVANKFSLMPDGISDEAKFKFVSAMRDRISREAMVIEAPTPRGPSTTVSFSVYYEDENPKHAQEIANELGELYVAENTRIRISLAEGANSFLKNEADKLKTIKTELESKLAVFKRDNFSVLPENVSGNLHNLDQADVALKGLERQIQQLEQQLIELNRQLRLNQSSEGVALIQQTLDEKRLELSQMKLKFHDAHPDIIELKLSIAELEKQIESGASSANLDSLPDEISLLDSPRDDGLVITLKSRIKQTQNELKYNREQQSIWQDKKVEYEKRLAKSPEVEQQYQHLVADYDNVKEDLQDIEEKQLAARLSLQLEKERKAERFVVIEPAALPSSPYKPNRPALVLLGFVLAAGAGVLSVALGERFSTTVNGPEGVRAVLKEPPLAIIPAIDKSSLSA